MSIGLLPIIATWLALSPLGPAPNPSEEFPPPPPAPQSLAARIDALPYTVPDLHGFHVIDTVWPDGLILTAGPRDRSPDLAQPVVFIAGAGPLPDLTRPDYAEQIARTAYDNGDPHVLLKSIERRDNVTFVTVEGSAQFKFMALDTSIYFAEIFRIGPHLTLHLNCKVRWPLRAEFADRFRALADTVTAKAP